MKELKKKFQIFLSGNEQTRQPSPIASGQRSWLTNHPFSIFTEDVTDLGRVYSPLAGPWLFFSY
jgi:hypothetical protein